MADPFARIPIATAPISVILASHNPGEPAADVVSAWYDALEELENEHEIIVADGGSTDGSRERLAEMFSGNSKIKLVQIDGREGIGAALRGGLNQASLPLVCLTTVDQQFEPNDLKALLAEIDKVDLVCGYRKFHRVPKWYRLAEVLYRSFVRIVFGISLDPLPCWLGASGFWRRRAARWLFGILLHDPECAFQLARRNLFQRIPIQSDGEFVHVEITAKANFLGAMLTETGVTWQPPPQNEIAQADTTRPSWWKEMHKVLSHPKFGPADVPEFSLTPTEPKDSESPVSLAQES